MFNLEEENMFNLWSELQLGKDIVCHFAISVQSALRLLSWL